MASPTARLSPPRAGVASSACVRIARCSSAWPSKATRSTARSSSSASCPWRGASPHATSTRRAVRRHFQVACIGLVNAIDRYDLSRGRAFSSFAVPTIVGEIKRYYRDKTWAVRVPRDLQDRVLAVDRAARELESALGRSPPSPSWPTPGGQRRGRPRDPARRPRSPRYLARRPRRRRRPTTLGDTIANHEEASHRAEERPPGPRDRHPHPARATDPRAALRARPHPGRDRPSTWDSARCRSRGSCVGDHQAARLRRRREHSRRSRLRTTWRARRRA